MVPASFRPRPVRPANNFFDAHTFRPTKLTFKVYCAILVLTASLAASQILILPWAMTPADFALVILAISVTQAFQQAGDFGFGNASFRSDVAPEVRTNLRESALLTSTVSWCLAMLICIGGSVVFGAQLMIFAAACTTGWLLTTSKMRASSAIQHLDERRAATENLVWQNAPKLGLVSGSFFGATVSVALGALAAAGLGRPRLPSSRGLAGVLKSQWRLWVPGLGLVVSAFLMAWAETYVLTIASDLVSVAQYQAVVRPMTGLTYVYLPLVSLLQVALNARDFGRALKILSLALAAVCLAAGTLGLLLVFYGSLVWGDFDFPVALVALVAGSTVACALSAFAGNFLIVFGHQGVAAVSTALGAATLMVLSAILVQPYGIKGAALASLSAWSLVALLQVSFALQLYIRGVRGRRARD